MIIYFSGNGNSEAIAVALSEKLKNSVLNLRGENLISPTRCKIELSQREPVVWVFPVYSWGVPPVVSKFIKECNISCNLNNHYLVLTCGDDCGLTAMQWEKIIKQRGWNPKGKISVFMPNTYVLMKGFNTDTKTVEAQKIKTAMSEINEIADLIKCEFDDDKTFKGKFAWIKSKIIYPWFIRYAMSPKPFHVNNSCISCGKCARSCPMDNITMADNKSLNKTIPEWGNNCAMCLSCYHKCPVHAVEYGKETQSKGQYTFPTTINLTR